MNKKQPTRTQLRKGLNRRDEVSVEYRPKPNPFLDNGAKKIPSLDIEDCIIGDQFQYETESRRNG